MCPMPWWISGLLHNLAVPNYAVHVLFLMMDCVGTCAVPLGYIQAWINQPPFCNNSIWCECRSIFVLPSLLRLDNSLVWHLTSVLHVFTQYIWPLIHKPPMKMWQVSICDSIGLACACMVSTPWVPIFRSFAYWQGLLPVRYHTSLFEFHSIYTRCVQCHWGFITWWSPMVGYQ